MNYLPIFRQKQLDYLGKEFVVLKLVVGSGIVRYAHINFFKSVLKLLEKIDTNLFKY